MFKNILKITLRNLIRNGSYTTINVLGLALGITCTLIIFLIVTFQLSFDNYHDEGENIYRVVTKEDAFGDIDYDTGVPYPLPEALRNDFPNIPLITIIDSNFGDPVISIDDGNGNVNRFEEKNAVYVDEEYFQIFSYNIISGNPDTWLKDPYTIVITKSIAEKYFKEEEPMGRSLILSGDQELKVTGIVQDPPKNTEFPFNFFISFETPNKNRSDNWGSISSAVQCYVKIPSEIAPEDINDAFPAFLRKYVDNERVDKKELSLQSLADVHYDNEYGYTFTSYSGQVSKESILALSLIGIFLLVTACINFINLNTVLVLKRSKEVGIRKVLGGLRSMIIGQFFLETTIICLLALIVSFGIVELALIKIDSLIGYPLDFNPLSDIIVVGFIGLVLILIIVLSGIYPAMVLSGFKPVDSLKSKAFNTNKSGISLRRILVALQFVISQILIVSTLVVTKQMELFRNVPLGFDKNAIIVVSLPSQDDSKLSFFKNSLLAESFVKNVSYSSTKATSGNVWTSNFKYTTPTGMIEDITHVKWVDEDFVSTYGLKLLAGEDLTPTDTINKYLVNEALVKSMGLNDYSLAIGEEIRTWGKTLPISGVVKDFNTTSLHDAIEPVVIGVRKQYNIASIKIGMNNLEQELARIEALWNESFPNEFYDFEFLDESIAQFYEDEEKASRIFTMFALIAIFIGCMGLFGLVSFMANQRVKEVGIRKVLGASITQIVMLFSREFALLVIVAFIIAGPIAYYMMDGWLNDFAYKISLSPWIFVTGVLISLAIAFVTVGYRSVKAALANPVNSLKDE